MTKAKICRVCKTQGPFTNICKLCVLFLSFSPTHLLYCLFNNLRILENSPLKFYLHKTPLSITEKLTSKHFIKKKEK